MQKIPNPINSRRKSKTPYLKFSALRCKYAPNSISISAITRKNSQVYVHTFISELSHRPKKRSAEVGDNILCLFNILVPLIQIS